MLLLYLQLSMAFPYGHVTEDADLILFQVSRSIGDVYLKKPEFNRDPIFQKFGNLVPLKHPVMTAEPSIVIRKLMPQDSFLIFASDGLWEQLTDQAAVEIVFKNPRAVSAHTLTFFLSRQFQFVYPSLLVS